MKHSKKLIIAASSAGVIGIAGIGASVMAAASGSSATYPSIVQKIASTFNLDPAKVNDVFKAQHQANQSVRQAKLKTTLDAAVKDGKLTQDQETKLIAEIQALRSQLKSDTSTDRHQDIKDFKTKLQDWTSANGITNLDEILPAPGGMHHGMMGGNDGDADNN